MAMAASLFKRPHHTRIAQVLQALYPLVLDRCGCLFGGGKAIARVQEREGWLEACLKQMQVTTPRASVLALIKKLAQPAKPANTF
ncbi:hypothetical protein [Aquabacterium sp.]|uniref:hypothetical protein n=1 Tax=Aquabacterium sp. TaxID=1872578 RepID=UPI0019C66CE0|nr:hypothetical protein [Aquabacterium sp.]MBC7700229.1 hypothetical protein [Aquabacterium sp.]